jgi:hypothetical protein
MTRPGRRSNSVPRFSSMDSFVIHIYRRATESNDPVAGVVERIGSEGRTAFRTREELWNIIAQTVQPDECPSGPSCGVMRDHGPPGK